jgi:hypothetical protein
MIAPIQVLLNCKTFSICSFHLPHGRSVLVSITSSPSTHCIMRDLQEL